MAPSCKERSSTATKLKVRFLDLVRPRCMHVVGKLHIAQAFELFRWMVRTSEKFAGDRSVGTARELLSASSCVGLRRVEPFGANWRQDLWNRFHFAVLKESVSPAAAAWRRAYSINETGTRVVPIRYYTWSGGGLCSHDTGQLLDRVIRANGHLRKVHNECHPRARWLYNCALRPTASAWELFAYYGFKTDHSSSWMLPICHQQTDELFVDFLTRADRKLGQLQG